MSDRDSQTALWRIVPLVILLGLSCCALPYRPTPGTAATAAAMRGDLMDCTYPVEREHMRQAGPAIFFGAAGALASDATSDPDTLTHAKMQQLIDQCMVAKGYQLQAGR